MAGEESQHSCRILLDLLRGNLIWPLETPDQHPKDDNDGADPLKKTPLANSP